MKRAVVVAGAGVAGGILALTLSVQIAILTILIAVGIAVLVGLTKMSIAELKWRPKPLPKELREAMAFLNEADVEWFRSVGADWVPPKVEAKPPEAIKPKPKSNVKVVETPPPPPPPVGGSGQSKAEGFNIGEGPDFPWSVLSDLTSERGRELRMAVSNQRESDPSWETLNDRLRRDREFEEKERQRLRYESEELTLGERYDYRVFVVTGGLVSFEHLLHAPTRDAPLRVKVWALDVSYEQKIPTEGVEFDGTEVIIGFEKKFEGRKVGVIIAGMSDGEAFRHAYTSFVEKYRAERMGDHGRKKRLRG